MQKNIKILIWKKSQQNDILVSDNSCKIIVVLKNSRKMQGKIDFSFVGLIVFFLLFYRQQNLAKRGPQRKRRRHLRQW